MLAQLSTWNSEPWTWQSVLKSSKGEETVQEVHRWIRTNRHPGEPRDKNLVFFCYIIHPEVTHSCRVVCFLCGGTQAGQVESVGH